MDCVVLHLCPRWIRLGYLCGQLEAFNLDYVCLWSSAYNVGITSMQLLLSFWGILRMEWLHREDMGCWKQEQAGWDILYGRNWTAGTHQTTWKFKKGRVPKTYMLGILHSDLLRAITTGEVPRPWRKKKYTNIIQREYHSIWYLWWVSLGLSILEPQTLT